MSLAALALGILTPLHTVAQVILPNTANPCPVVGIPCGSGNGAFDAAAFLEFEIFPAIRVLFIAAAVIMFLQYSLKLLFDPDSSETVSSAKLAYGYGITACAIVGISTYIVDAVGQNENTRANIIDPEPIDEGIGLLILYIRLVVATLVALFLLIQGIRLIMKQGSEEEFTKAKTQFFHTIMGIAVILVTSAIVEAFTEGPAEVLAIEIVGLINFVLVLIGALAVASVIIAGIMLVVSVDESMKDRAKKAIVTAVVGLIIALMSYILVAFFINVGNAASA